MQLTSSDRRSFLAPALGLALVAVLGSRGGVNAQAPAPMPVQANPWLQVNNSVCAPDLTFANACNQAGISFCTNPQPATQYCSGFVNPGVCSTQNNSTCWLQQNVPCGTMNSCATQKPIQQNGANVNCTGAPDQCANVAPANPNPPAPNPPDPTPTPAPTGWNPTSPDPN